MNRVAPLLARVQELRLPDPTLDVHDLLARARHEALLEDFGPGDFRPGLDLLVDSINADVRPHAAGAQLLRELIGAQLRNRVGVRDWSKKNPWCRNESIAAPIVMCGLPGAGTDLAAGLLGHDDAVRVVRIGEALVSSAPRGALPVSYRPDPRSERVADVARRVGRAVDLAGGLSTSGSTLPTPEMPASGDVVLGGHFASPLAASLIGAHSYVDWAATADFTPAYRWQASVLQVLQMSQPTAQWFLHGTVHLTQLRALLDVHPDARIVWLHRDPLATAAIEDRQRSSVSGLLTTRQDDGVTALGAHLDQLATAESHVEMTGAEVLHLHYAELHSDPVGTMDRVYRQFDLELSTAARWRMDAWLARRGAAGSTLGTRGDQMSTPDEARRRAYLEHREVVSEVV